MKELTRAEEQIMQVLWDLGKGFVKDIIDNFRSPGQLTTQSLPSFGFCRIKDLSVTKLLGKVIVIILW